MIEEEKIEQTEHRTHGKGVYGMFALLFIIAIAAWLGTLQWKGHLSVSGIIVDGEHILTKAEVVKLAQISMKTKMYDIDLTAVQKNIEKNHFVKSVAVMRDAPSTVRILVEERMPIALLSFSGTSGLLYIDEDGYILPHVTTQAIFDLPMISGADSQAVVAVGHRTLNTDVLAAIEALDFARQVSSELFHMISEVNIRDGHDMVLYSAEGGVPIIFGRGDAAKKMVKLDGFWKEFITEQGSSNIRYIDLRFEDQVIVSSTSKKAS